MGDVDFESIIDGGLVAGVLEGRLRAVE
jgi:hypothetical protein